MEFKPLKRFAVTLTVGAMLLTTACGKGPEGVAATVNDKEIKTEDFVREYAITRNKYVQMAGTEDILKDPIQENAKESVDEYIKEMSLKNLIDLELIKQEAEKEGIKADIAEVDKTIESIKEQFGSEEEYQKALKKEGITEEFYKSHLLDLQLMKKFNEKKLEEQKATEDEMKKYYEKNKADFYKAKASHILVATLEDAAKLKKELDKGADFAKLAKENSTDPGSKDNGGSLGEFVNGTMVPEFDSAIKVMKAGQISDPIKTQFGYHLIKLEEISERKFEDVKDSLEEIVTKTKINDYMQGLEKSAKIKKYVDPKKEVEIPEEYKLKIETPAEQSAPAEKEKNSNSEKKENKEENKPAEETKK